MLRCLMSAMLVSSVDCTAGKTGCCCLLTDVLEVHLSHTLLGLDSERLQRASTSSNPQVYQFRGWWMQAQAHHDATVCMAEMLECASCFSGRSSKTFPGTYGKASTSMFLSILFVLKCLVKLALRISLTSLRFHSDPAHRIQDAHATN